MNGLARSETSYRNGFPLTEPHDFGNDVTWLPSSAHFGNIMPVTDPSFNSNPVRWKANPAKFGNTIL